MTILAQAVAVWLFIAAVLLCGVHPVATVLTCGVGWTLGVAVVFLAGWFRNRQRET